MNTNFGPAKDWPTTSLEKLALDEEKLAELEQVVPEQYGNIAGIVIARRGYLAYEKYFGGCGPEDAIHVASVTKSVLSALIGIAVDRGDIKSVEEKVLSFFPEYAGENALQCGDVTLRELLTMTAAWPFGNFQEPLDTLSMQEDWVAYALGQLGQGDNAGGFKYSSAGAHLLSAVLTRATGKSALAFANEHLFGPASMTGIPKYPMEEYSFDTLFAKVRGWPHDPNGYNTGGWGLSLTVRDMARFGQLYLQGGTWDGKQVISGNWVTDSWRKSANLEGGWGYGYLWVMHEEEGLPVKIALGDGGNAIVCIPELDLVVAVASTMMYDAKDRWELVRDHILPAVLDR